MNISNKPSTDLAALAPGKPTASADAGGTDAAAKAQGGFNNLLARWEEKHNELPSTQQKTPQAQSAPQQNTATQAGRQRTEQQQLQQRGQAQRDELRRQDAQRSTTQHAETQRNAVQRSDAQRQAAHDASGAAAKSAPSQVPAPHAVQPSDSQPASTPGADATQASADPGTATATSGEGTAAALTGGLGSAPDPLHSSLDPTAAAAAATLPTGLDPALLAQMQMNQANPLTQPVAEPGAADAASVVQMSANPLTSAVAEPGAADAASAVQMSANPLTSAVAEPGASSPDARSAVGLSADTVNADAFRSDTSAPARRELNAASAEPAPGTLASFDGSRLDFMAQLRSARLGAGAGTGLDAGPNGPGATLSSTTLQQTIGDKAQADRLFTDKLLSPEALLARVETAALAVALEAPAASGLHGRQEAKGGFASALGSQDTVGLDMRSGANQNAQSLGVSASIPVDAAPETAVASQVAVWVSQNIQSAEITLDAHGLDPVEVSISLVGNEARVEFRSDTPETRDMLNRAAAELDTLLRQEGLVLSGVSVGTSNQRPAGGQAQDQSTFALQQRQARTGGVGAPGAGSGVRMTLPVRVPQGAVDLFV